MSTLRLFVTGTDTGVGKTRIATALCLAFGQAGRRVAAMKPVASGCARTAAGLRSDDALALLGAMNVDAAYAEVNPFAFEPAIAPHIASEEAGRRIELDRLDRAYMGLRARSEVTVVEGSGGWLAPLDERHTFADLAVRWNLEVVLVVGIRLGCLNHALLTAESIERRGLTLRGWVANSADAQCERREANVETLRRRLAAPCWGDFVHAPASDAREIANSLRAHLSP